MLWSRRSSGDAYVSPNIVQCCQMSKNTLHFAGLTNLFIRWCELSMFFMLHKVRNPRKGFAREYTLCSGRERGNREEGSCTYRGSPKQFLFLKIAAALPTWTRGGKSSSEACIQMRERGTEAGPELSFHNICQ